MKNFLIKAIRYYGAALAISLLACWGMTWVVFTLLESVKAYTIMGSIWFEAGLTTVEVCSCMLVVNGLRPRFVPLDEDEEDPVFDISTL